MLSATVTFLRTEDGGRRSPVFSGYRGQFFFDGTNFEVVRMEFIPDDRMVSPGETADAKFITFTDNSTVALRGRISAGQSFQLREGAKVVANGVVTAVEDDLC